MRNWKSFFSTEDFEAVVGRELMLREKKWNEIED
jgi:hypothetical protein